MIRTRVGYAGGTTPAPTYHNLGDHSESVEIDYDLDVVSYDELLGVYFAGHSPTRPPYSVQYRSAVFYRTEAERDAVEAAIARVRAAVGSVYVAVEPFSSFHSAEDYHQKYTLRRYADVTKEFRRMYPAEDDLVDSTAVARVNGWLSGCATTAQLDAELPRTGLTDETRAKVRGLAMPGGRSRISCGA